jgi:hypothetical protein
MDNPIVFHILGGSGFRAQAYLQIARELPDRFRVGGMVVRNEEKRASMKRAWQIPVYGDLDSLLRSQGPPDFVVVSVSKSASAGYLHDLAQRGIPALAETPPAPDVNGLLWLHEELTRKGARIQVAEQYPLQPMHAARQEIIRSGALGNVNQATVSFSQTYHAASLLRRMLGIGFEPATIRGMRFESPWLAGPDRGGPPTEEKLITSQRDLAWLDFGGKLGIYDFTYNQHRSWIRSNHISVRGERGELFDHRLDVMSDYATPLHLEVKRIQKGEEGNMEGHFLDASQDHYLGLMIEEAIRTGDVVQTVRQPWALTE